MKCVGVAAGEGERPALRGLQDKAPQARNTADSDQPYTTNETAVYPQSNTGVPRSQNQRHQPPTCVPPVSG